MRLITIAAMLMGTVIAASGEYETHDVSEDSLTSHSIDSLDSGTYVDPRDGESYRWVRIGEQLWMAENLRFATTEGSWCWDNNEQECTTRGRFYNWETAQRVAPPGWHLPSDEEWKTLELSLGLDRKEIDREGARCDEAKASGGMLKAQGQWPTEYNGKKISVTNEAGFSAIPTGVYALGEFSHDGYTAWWTSTADGDEAWIRFLHFFDNKIDRVKNSKIHAFPIRCVRDAKD